MGVPSEELLPVVQDRDGDLYAKNEEGIQFGTAQSLRSSLVLYVLVGTLLPMLVVGILSGKIDNGISASLRQEALNLENAIDNLDFASKQFELDGQILEDVRFFAGEALEADIRSSP
ncbi:hypothetical protein D3C81_145610 [compost metagenome]